MPTVQVRMVASLVNVSPELAREVAEGLGIPLPTALPRALPHPPTPEVTRSAALSQASLLGEDRIRTRKVALLAADGVHGASLLALEAALQAAGLVTVVIAPALGPLNTADGTALRAGATLENTASVLFDAIILPDGEAGVAALGRQEQTREFITHPFRHGKTILALGLSEGLLDMADVPPRSSGSVRDPGLLRFPVQDLIGATRAFLAAMALQRHAGRQEATRRRPRPTLR